MKNTLLSFLVLMSMAVHAQDLGVELAAAALERTSHFVWYDGSYQKLAYPNGDVAKNRGVCTDLVVRAYRNAHGIDLQVHVHEDMQKDFKAYPQQWDLKKPDASIDHRRTQNLECFFKRMGAELPITDDPEAYLPGDIVFYGDIGFGHVGIVSSNRSLFGDIPLVIHNIGMGPREDNFLFDSRITGHYRWNPKDKNAG